MKKSLIVLITALAFTAPSFAVESAKKPVTTAPAKKCDMLKDKNCNKPAPSANKPVPKKKKEAK